MRAKRWELSLYSFYDHTGIERHFEEMARKGWMIENLGGLWRYRRCEPRPLRFCVAYYPEASEYDPIQPSEGELTFWDYCAAAGWVRVAKRAQMQVFCNEDENAVPIETEAAVQVETLHRAAAKEYLLGQWILILIALVQLALNLLGRRENLADAISDIGRIGVLTDYLLLVLLCGGDLCSYYRWRRRAKRAAEELGRFTPTHSHRRIQAAVLAVVLLIGALQLGAGNSRAFLFGLGYMAILLVVVGGTKAILRRRNVSAEIAKVTTVLVTIAVSLFMMYGIVNATADHRLKEWIAPVPSTAEAYEYISRETQGVKYYSTAYAYHDPLPLYVEDLTQTDYDLYSCALTRDASPLAVRQDVRQELRWGDWGVDAPELFYTIYDIRFSPLFAPCRDDLLSKYEKRDYNPYTYYAVDPAPWGADGAWRLCDGAEEGEDWFNSWILTYGKRIVLLSTDTIDMDAEKMAVVGEKLGK